MADLIALVLGGLIAVIALSLGRWLGSIWVRLAGIDRTDRFEAEIAERLNAARLRHRWYAAYNGDRR